MSDTVSSAEKAWAPVLNSTAALLRDHDEAAAALVSARKNLEGSKALYQAALSRFELVRAQLPDHIATPSNP